MKKTPRYAVVTPYYQESRETLERCLTSVENQMVKCDHFLVADGFPQTWVDERSVRHVKLPAAHGDYGDVARGLGALLAVAEGYAGIGFLDADNWYDADHAERCVEAGNAKPAPADLVIAKRRLIRPDGTALELVDEPDHVDTSCFWFQAGAFPYLHYWVTMPKEVSAIGDRIFARVVRERRLTAARTAKQTVNYFCLWESAYRTMGETPPPGAKPNIDSEPIFAWFLALSREERRRVIDLCGTNVAR